jgi:hypothetical protein
MVRFQTKNPNLGKFCRALEGKKLVYCMAIWNLIWSFGNFMSVWYIFPRFGILNKDKSGSRGVGSISARQGHLIFD